MGFVVSYSPLSVNEYWPNIFCRILVTLTYFVAIQEETLLWNLGAEGTYAVQSNK